MIMLLCHNYFEPPQNFAFYSQPPQHFAFYSQPPQHFAFYSRRPQQFASATSAIRSISHSQPPQTLTRFRQQAVSQKPSVKRLKADSPLLLSAVTAISGCHANTSGDKFQPFSFVVFRLEHSIQLLTVSHAEDSSESSADED